MSKMRDKLKREERKNIEISDFVLVLENVENPNNIGAILRSAEFFGLSKIYLIESDEIIARKKKYIGAASMGGYK
ncbi:MAG: hypothetical protein CVU81_00930 [Euryarchaeota archaeon HGW-Euryarchaeota-1]|nr:MAG: hypothetical protein CVU81_00930 [Euryarchaeota archaeon HGW-Euryarchaeota-1]